MQAEVERAALNWDFPPVSVLSWSMLSSARGEALLAEAAGDGTFALVADEAHVLRSSTSARTKRFTRLRVATATRSRVVLMSGTLTRQNLLDLSDVAWLALASRSPVPTGTTCDVLAAYVESPALGRGWREADAVRKWAGESQITTALGKRIRTAPGVVTTTDQAVSCPIYVVPIRSMPLAVEAVRMANEVAATFRVPDGDDLVTPADVARAQRQLSLGYRMIWTWRHGPDRAWIEARRAYTGALRRLLATDDAQARGIDTELQAVKACASTPDDPLLAELLEVMASHGDTLADRDRRPISKPAWITGAIMDQLIDLASAQPACLFWYDEQAVADYVRAAGVRVAPLGERFAFERGVTAVSLRSHATGLNLQAWSKNVVSTVPPAGALWEQMLGRTHRPGQNADGVVVWRPAWSGVLNAAWRSAHESAKWIEQSLGQVQKLSLCQEVSNGDFGF